MFRWIKKFSIRIDKMEDSIVNIGLALQKFQDELKTCAACGCLIKEGIKGPPIMKKKFYPFSGLINVYHMPPDISEFKWEVYESLYCFKCAPKTQEAVKISEVLEPNKTFDEWNW